MAAAEAARAAAVAARSSKRRIEAATAVAAAASLEAAAYSLRVPVCEAEAVRDEARIRQQASEPALLKKIAAGRDGCSALVPGHERAGRNLAWHWQLGAGAEKFADAMKNPQRKQRAGHRRKARSTTTTGTSDDGSSVGGHDPWVHDDPWRAARLPAKPVVVATNENPWDAWQSQTSSSSISAIGASKHEWSGAFMSDEMPQSQISDDSVQYTLAVDFPSAGDSPVESHPLRQPSTSARCSVRNDEHEITCGRCNDGWMSRFTRCSHCPVASDHVDPTKDVAADDMDNQRDDEHVITCGRCNGGWRSRFTRCSHCFVAPVDHASPTSVRPPQPHAPAPACNEDPVALEGCIRCGQLGHWASACPNG